MLKSVGNKTHKHLQLNAGALLYGVDMAAVDDADTMRSIVEEAMRLGSGYLGAVRNVSFTASQSIKQCAVDSLDFCGADGVIAGKWDIRLTAELVEFTPDAFSLLLSQAYADDADVKRISLDIGPASETLSCFPLQWVSDLSGGGLIVIELRNAINTTGISFSAAHDREGHLSVSFIPAAGDSFDSNAQPFTVYFLG